jgi:hypothetical protein
MVGGGRLFVSIKRCSSWEEKQEISLDEVKKMIVAQEPDAFTKKLKAAAKKAPGKKKA